MFRGYIRDKFKTLCKEHEKRIIIYQSKKQRH